MPSCARSSVNSRCIRIEEAARGDYCGNVAGSTYLLAYLDLKITARYITIVQPWSSVEPNDFVLVLVQTFRIGGMSTDESPAKHRIAQQHS